jgi:hypothetical protein
MTGTRVEEHGDATVPAAAQDVPPSGATTSDAPGGRRRMLVALVVLLLAGVAGGVIAATHPFVVSHASTAVQSNLAPTSLATVTEGALASQVNTTGTLGYRGQSDGSAYSVINQASGVLSALPRPGEVITRGQVLYRVSNQPVILLYGRTPMYRSLYEGDSGPDVRELNRNLVALRYATAAELDPSSDYFSTETAYALERLQVKLGIDETGSLTEGQVVFLSGPLRITSVAATLGTAAPPNAPIAQATTTARQVVVELDASQQTEVRVGDKAQITLPDNHVTPGIVTGVGTTATSSGGSSGSTAGSSGATLPVYIALRRPQDAGNLNQAPVQVQITAAGVKQAMIVPVDSLLAQSAGGYAVETVDERGVHHIVPVTVGLFDDADGLVQVMNTTLSPGDRIVVPST